MQTPKSKIGSLEVPPRKSPATLRTARQLKSSGPDLDTKNPPSRTPKTSPKVLDRRSPRNPVTEKKRPGLAVSELESQLAAARREAEEARARLEEISRCEDDRVLELRALSQERDKAWQSELEAVQRQHSMDSAALASAAAEIHKLKAQLDHSAELSEAVEEASRARTESLEGLVAELQAKAGGSSEAAELVRELRDELDHRKAAEEEAAAELEQSRARVRSLEGLVGKLQAEVITGGGGGGDRDSEEVKELRAESARLRSALDAAEVRYQEEFIRSTLQIRSAYEQAERTRAEWAGQEAELRGSRARVGELEARLLDMETELRSVSEENEGLRRCRAGAAEEELAGLRAGLAEAEARGRAEAEGELRRVKVQAEQWRKAAEAGAAAMLSGAGSPCSEDLDDDSSSPKKKNVNVLKKFGVLWKKGAQK